jgi:hypothetical protein
MKVVHITFEADPEVADRASLALMRAAEARVRRGEPPEVVDTIAFESIEGMFSTLTPTRLARCGRWRRPSTATIAEFTPMSRRYYSWG